MRTKRTNGSTTYTYFYDGSNLHKMKVGSDTLTFIYGYNGHPMAVKYNYSYYYYVTNTFGDVLAILDDEGAEVVTYTYDAWGNILTTGGSMASTLGAYNPLRYRGYVYDQETGLYYLQSRYYNPTICRFISADALLATGQGALGYNLFAYCLNNPVNMRDTTGLFGVWALLGITLASMLIGGTGQLVSNALAGETGSDLWRGVAGAAVGAGSNAFTLCLTLPTGVASLFIAASVGSLLQTSVDSLELAIRGENIVVGQTMIDLGINFASTLLGNYMGGAIVPTNAGWFQPRRFLSVFTRPYGQKILLQSTVGTGLSSVINFLRKFAWENIISLFPSSADPTHS